jgi:hypothetical protein
LSLDGHTKNLTDVGGWPYFSGRKPMRGGPNMSGMKALF